MVYMHRSFRAPASYIRSLDAWVGLSHRPTGWMGHPLFVCGSYIDPHRLAQARKLKQRRPQARACIYTTIRLNDCLIRLHAVYTLQPYPFNQSFSPLTGV